MQLSGHNYDSYALFSHSTSLHLVYRFRNPAKDAYYSVAFARERHFFMKIIFFITEDYVWTNSVSEKIFDCFCKNIGLIEAIILSDKNRFYNEIHEIIKRYEKTVDCNSMPKIQLRELSCKNKTEYKMLIETSDLLFIDEKRKREIAYHYIPYSYAGKFFFI